MFKLGPQAEKKSLYQLTRKYLLCEGDYVNLHSNLKANYFNFVFELVSLSKQVEPNLHSLRNHLVSGTVVH